MNTRPIIASLCLILAAIGIVLTRMAYLKTPLTPSPTKSHWHIQAKIEITGKKGPINIPLSVPSQKLTNNIVDEQFNSAGFGIASVFNNDTRKVVWNGKLQNNEKLTFFYNVAMKPGINNIKTVKKPENISYNQAVAASEVPLVQKLLETQYVKNIDNLTYVSQISNCVKRANCKDGEFLGRFQNSNKKRALVLRYILATAGYKALVARGFDTIKADSTASFVYWVRAEIDGSWKDLFIDQHGSHSSKLIFWDYYESTVANPEDEQAKKQEATVTYALSAQDGFELDENVSPNEYNNLAWRILSLKNVPLSMQVTYKLILLIPLGALVVCFLRNIVGLPTFGTFMPVLIGISFRDMGMFWGIALLSTIIVTGIFVRSFLAKLKLLMVPRLSATLSVVILIVLVFSRLAYELGFTPGLSITLFPIIIITMLIERMSVSLDEKGLRSSLTLYSTSMLSSVISYLIMTSNQLQYLLFTFPEVSLIILALIILCGRYTGYRLFEIYRFREFFKDAY